MQQTKKMAYRQRIYLQTDGTVIITFGSDPAPENAKLLADHDVVEVQTVTDHVEPVGE